MDRKICKFDANVIDSESNKVLVSGTNTVVDDVLVVTNATSICFNYEILYLEDDLQHSIDVVGDCNATAEVNVTITLNNGFVVLQDNTSIWLDDVSNRLNTLFFSSEEIITKGNLKVLVTPNAAGSVTNLKEIFVNRITHTTDFSRGGPPMTIDKEVNDDSGMIKFVDQGESNGGYIFDFSMFNTVSNSTVGDRIMLEHTDKDVFEDQSTVYIKVKVPEIVSGSNTSGKTYYIPMHSIELA